jgi:hypothetical protein
VPGVTTILNHLSKGDGLLQWAANCSSDYIKERLVGDLTDEDVQRICYEARSAHKHVKEQAASIGTIAHDWLEQHLKGVEQPWPENEHARLSCEAGLRWLDLHHWQLVACEQMLYSPTYNYAGKLDWLGIIDGCLDMPDWKTSKGIFSTYRYQTAAYNIAAEELEDIHVENRWILRIDKFTGAFEELKMPRAELEKDFEAFKGLLAVHNREAELNVRKPRVQRTAAIQSDVVVHSNGTN